MDRALGARLRVSRLFDAYGRLLTERQQTLLRLYYLRDHSLGEIAEERKITRQAVADSLHRSVHELERLEASLHVLAQQRAMAERVTALEDAIRDLTDRLDRVTVNRLLAGVHELRKAAG